MRIIKITAFCCFRKGQIRLIQSKTGKVYQVNIFSVHTPGSPRSQNAQISGLRPHNSYKIAHHLVSLQLTLFAKVNNVYVVLNLQLRF